MISEGCLSSAKRSEDHLIPAICSQSCWTPGMCSKGCFNPATQVVLLTSTHFSNFISLVNKSNKTLVKAEKLDFPWLLAEFTPNSQYVSGWVCTYTVEAEDDVEKLVYVDVDTLPLAAGDTLLPFPFHMLSPPAIHQHSNIISSIAFLIVI